MPVHIHAYEEPRWSIRLERESEEGESEQQLAAEILDAMEVLAAGWLEPLALHLSIGCYDTESYYAPGDCEPPRPQWFLRKEVLPPGVKASFVYVDPVTDTAPALTAEGIRAWVAHAMAQECPNAPRYVTSWRELYWAAVRARLPEPARVADRDGLQVSCYAGTVAVPFERAEGEAWVSGPCEQYGFGPPIRLIARNHDGVVAIDLEICWSPWFEDPAGREQVDAALRRVLARERGWRRTEY